MARKKKIEVPFILLENKYGSREYESLYNEVIVNGELTPAQQNIFLVYCIEYGNFIKLELEIIAEGEVITAGNKTKIPNPKCALKQSALKSFMSAATQLGLTPKTKIKTGTKVALTPLDIMRTKSKKG